MKKIVVYSVCITVIVSSCLLNLYELFVLAPKRAQTFVFSQLSTLYLDAMRPAFWLCSGILLSNLLSGTEKFGNRRQKLKRSALGIALLMLGFYCILYGVIVLEPAGIGTALSIELFKWLRTHTIIFMIPGFLIGMAML